MRAEEAALNDKPFRFRLKCTHDFTIRVDKDVYRRLRRMAAEKRCSASELIRQMIAHCLEGTEEEQSA